MRALLASSLVLLAVAVVSAQQPTFRSGTRVVPLPTMVTDGSGRLLPDLQKEDFTVLDNGKPQDIVLFENTVQPFSVVVMLDLSASMELNRELLLEATEEFLLRMLPDDKGKVGAFNDKIRMSASFTSNRDALLAELSDYKYFIGQPTRLYDAIDASIEELQPLEGRRVVLVFTDGEDTKSRVSYGAVRDRAQRDDIMIYAIGLRSRILGEVTSPDRDLKKLAEATGGGYFELRRTDDLGPTFTRVAQELHSLYTIGFSPATLDGKEHRLQVRTTDSSHKIRTRNSYIATIED
jgi:Ca-activated chloride channel family protein